MTSWRQGSLVPGVQTLRWVWLASQPHPLLARLSSAYLFNYYLSLLIELLRASKDQDHHIVIHRGVEKVKRLNRKHLELNGWNILMMACYFPIWLPRRLLRTERPHSFALYTRSIADSCSDLARLFCLVSPPVLTPPSFSISVSFSFYTSIH